ncbi:MAG: PEGA domain-containing protein [Candidatus Symbiothrix sp.]|jgi:hypothetical protein|nr:PEGA domain-containing protein [Candidatus Symbiothrix sp.]
MNFSFFKIIIALIVFCAVPLEMNAQTKKLVIEPLNESEGVDIRQEGRECVPGAMVFTIKSDVPNLAFYSTLIDLEAIEYDAEKHQYVFCHRKESFYLTVASPSHISEEIYIDGYNSKYVFRIVDQTPKGKILFNTTPKNAMVDFGLEGQSPSLSGVVIEQNSGNYKVRISKFGYLSVDTAVLVPSDGSTVYIDLALKENFAKIKLDITSADKSAFRVFPVIDIGSEHINLADLDDPSNRKSFDDANNLEYFKIYSGGFIPVPPGNYNIVINTPGFNTYTTTLSAVKASTIALSAQLEPVVGYLTIIDNGNASGAKVLLDNEYIGEVPMFKHKTRIGNHFLRFEKEGFVSGKSEYQVLIKDGTESELPVAMSIFRRLKIVTTPIGAEVLVNTVREGFTPCEISLREGKHDMIVRKTGYLDYKQHIAVNSPGANRLDTLNIAMETTYPFTIASEADGLYVFIKRKKAIVADQKQTPAKILLPYGKYKLELYNQKNRKMFSGNITLKASANEIYVPCYSYGTFTTLVGDYFPSKPKAQSETGEYYSLLASAQFGRFNLFPGISTSIARASLFQWNKDSSPINFSVPEGEEGDPFQPDNEFLPAMSVLFTNAEVRLGGSIHRNLDIAAIGTYAWFPKLHELIEEIPFSYIDGHEMFLGVELSTRISYFNVNIKIGQERVKGHYNFLQKNEEGTSRSSTSFNFFREAFALTNTGITIGFTFGEKLAESNNIFRLWKKPLITNY